MTGYAALKICWVKVNFSSYIYLLLQLIGTFIRWHRNGTYKTLKNLIDGQLEWVEQTINLAQDTMQTVRKSQTKLAAIFD